MLAALIARFPWIGTALSVLPALLLAAALGIAAGNWITGALKDVELSQLREQAATADARAAEAAQQRLADAVARGDVLTTHLAEASAAAAELTKERDDAIRNGTTGRACLGTAALRVLDTARASAGLGLRMPEAPGGLAAAHAGAAAAAAAGEDAADGGEYATDTGVSLWIGGANDQYEECSRRLGALIDWHR